MWECIFLQGHIHTKHWWGCSKTKTQELIKNLFWKFTRRQQYNIVVKKSGFCCTFCLRAMIISKVRKRLLRASMALWYAVPGKSIGSFIIPPTNASTSCAIDSNSGPFVTLRNRSATKENANCFITFTAIISPFDSQVCSKCDLAILSILGTKFRKPLGPKNDAWKVERNHLEIQIPGPLLASISKLCVLIQS